MDFINTECPLFNMFCSQQEKQKLLTDIKSPSDTKT